VIQPRSRAVVMATASSRIAPFTQPCQKAETWLRVKPSATTPRKSTPTAVPKTPPSPPLNAVPPISTAAITVMIWVGSTSGEAPVSRPTWTRLPSPAVTPASA
jgi:hypothetical protein